jgi:hypothetical protein
VKEKEADDVQMEELDAEVSCLKFHVSRLEKQKAEFEAKAERLTSQTSARKPTSRDAEDAGRKRGVQI